jgi:hypothetical protein
MSYKLSEGKIVAFILVKAQIFSSPNRSDWPWAPHGSLSHGKRNLFSGGKAAAASHCLPSHVEIKMFGAFSVLPHTP